MLTGFPLLLAIALSILFIIVLCGKFKINPFLALLLVSFLLGFGVGMPPLTIVDAIQSGFGNLMKYIGLIVVLGSIIGVFLERSGAATRIANEMVSLAGKGNALGALSAIGALISIPVFCDSGFILLSGLTDRLSRISAQNKASFSLALGTGLYTTHTLVPPTPGPVAVAGNLGASDYLGTMILLGIGISIPVLILTTFLSRKLGANITIDQSELADETGEGFLPSLSASLLPLLVPVLMIATGTLLPFLGIQGDWVTFLGNPLTALAIGALIAILLLRPSGPTAWGQYLTDAIKVAGPILIITGAGGAFGGVLKATPLSDTVGQWLGSEVQYEIVALILVFVIAAVLKTAQGSSTSAMVISSALLAPLIPALGWDSPMDFALAVMAIGGGAMVVSHYNDSYFWVVSQFSGMSSSDTFRSFSLITGLMGLTVLGVVLLLSIVF